MAALHALPFRGRLFVTYELDPALSSVVNNRFPRPVGPKTPLVHVQMCRLRVKPY